ncbi:MAG: nitronate monooxygenase [Cyclobacteriaceae bacterium]|nr:nitronate monooxygenase [Cyclobacteriaceae bacterium]
MLGIRYPVILAPMFLVSNVDMIVAAIHAGFTGAIPALNYKSDREFRDAMDELRQKSSGSFGINLIANKSNIKLNEQLRVCLDYKVDFVITSLGNPAQIIEKCHEKGIRVFCDVVDERYGEKVASLKPDGLIAVNKDAGGHAGKLSSLELIEKLRKVTELPIISAGGVGHGAQLYEKLQQGAVGISMGSPFIASVESPVSKEYKEACVQYSAKDITMTTKLSGTPCTVINTPYVQKTGTKQNVVEAFLSKNRRFKKLFKMLIYHYGMKSLRKSAFGTTYQNVWCAGPSIDHVKDILPISSIIENLVSEYHKACEPNAAITR